jgi:hypothetical protein
MPASTRLRCVAVLIAALAASPAYAAGEAVDAAPCRARAAAAMADDDVDERATTAKLRAAIALCERVLSADDLLLASLNEELARVALEAGRVDEAGQLLRAALVLRERVQGADHPDAAETAATLAEVLWMRAHHTAEVEMLMRRALAVAARELDQAGPGAWPAARDLATRRAVQLTRFLLDQWRNADAAVALAAAHEDAPPLDAGHVHNGHAELALVRRDVCAAAQGYARAAERYRAADFANETSTDRRWLMAWIENAPGLLARVGQRRVAITFLGGMIAARSSMPHGQAITARFQSAVEALAPSPVDPVRC